MTKGKTAAEMEIIHKHMTKEARRVMAGELEAKITLPAEHWMPNPSPLGPKFVRRNPNSPGEPMVTPKGDKIEPAKEPRVYHPTDRLEES